MTNQPGRKRLREKSPGEKSMNSQSKEEYPLEVGSYCYILGHESTTDKRYRHGRVVSVVELPTKKRRSYKLTDIARPGAYYLYYLRRDLIRTDDPNALKRVRETVHRSPAQPTQ